MRNPLLIFHYIRMARLNATRRKLDAERVVLEDRVHNILLRQTGVMTMAWATLEATLEGAIAMAHGHGGRETIQPDLPASLKVKLAYLRKTPRHIPALNNLDADVQKFVDLIQDKKGMRHDLTHGITSVGKKLGHVRITRIGYDKTNLRFSTREVPIEDISEAVEDILALALRATVIGAAFAQTFGKRELEDTYREAAISISLSVKSSDKMRALID